MVWSGCLCIPLERLTLGLYICSSVVPSHCAEFAVLSSSSNELRPGHPRESVAAESRHFPLLHPLSCLRLQWLRHASGRVHVPCTLARVFHAWSMYICCACLVVCMFHVHSPTCSMCGGDREMYGACFGQSVWLSHGICSCVVMRLFTLWPHQEEWKFSILRRSFTSQVTRLFFLAGIAGARLAAHVRHQFLALCFIHPRDVANP